MFFKDDQDQKVIQVKRVKKDMLALLAYQGKRVFKVTESLSF